MAAGEGRRLRPITERWPKPMLPIDGRPVVVTLVHELAAAGCGPIVVVTGHLAEQVEELLEPLPVRPPLRPPAARARLGRRGARAEATPPYVVTAADTVYADGRPRPFRRAQAPAVDGAIAVHGDVPAAALAARGAGRPVSRPASRERRRTSSPTSSAMRSTAGAQVSAIQVGRTRDLTSPVDLVRENFPYLR